MAHFDIPMPVQEVGISLRHWRLAALYFCRTCIRLIAELQN